MTPTTLPTRARLGRRDALFVGGLLVATRAMLLLLIYASRLLLPERAANGNKDFIAFPHNVLLDSLCRWDSGWYHRIAERGYYFEGAQSDVAFFPAFPYLSRWVGRAVGSDFAGGLLLNQVALFGGLLFLLGLARRYLDEAGARRAVVFALVFPSSVFFSFYYTEALFFFAVTGALYFYERDDLAYAGVFGALASATRLAGALLLPAMALGALRRNGYRPAARMAWLVVSLAGLGVVVVTLWVQVHAPFSFITSQAGWGRSSVWPTTTLYREFVSMHADAWGVFVAIDLLTGVLALGAGVYSLRAFDVAQGLFLLASVLLPLGSGRTMALERYVLSAVPLYLVLARVTTNAVVERSVLITFSMWLAVHAVLFANWYWAG